MPSKKLDSLLEKLQNSTTTSNNEIEPLLDAEAEEISGGLNAGCPNNDACNPGCTTGPK